MSVSPSKKQTFNRDLVKQFKAIQDEEIKAWRGLNTKFTQRPGQQSNEVQHIQSVNPSQSQTQQNTQRKKITVHNSFTEELKQYQKIEERRLRYLLEVILKFRDYEDEQLKQQIIQGNASQIDSQQQLEERFEKAVSLQPQEQMHNINQIIKTEYVNFKPLKDSSILIRDGMTTIYFQKGAIFNSYLNDSSSELLFKLVKCEAKLLRSVLETNGFTQSDTHDWNLIWSSQSYKLQTYDNLSEY